MGSVNISEPLFFYLVGQLVANLFEMRATCRNRIARANSLP
jgi:hypothetical protein